MPQRIANARRVLQRGFTLIELMVVLLIIGVLAALIVPNVLDRADDAKVTAAKADISNLMQALKMYRLDNGRYPSAEQGLAALATKPTVEPMAPNWKKNLDDATIAKFQKELGAMGYKYQFITLAGIHNMWYHMFDLAQDYVARGMSAYVEKVQEPEFAARERGYSFVSHQQEVGTGYFDDVTTVIQGGKSSVTALTGSTEEEQFH